MKIALALFATCLAGCAANSGVISAGNDSYLVSRQAATGFSGSGTLKVEAIQEASQYCAGQNKKVQVKKSIEAKPPYILGNYPKAEVEFTCV